MHYHLVAGMVSGVAYAESRIDSYDESIDKFMGLTDELFSHLFTEEHNLTRERLVEEIERKDGKPIMVGTPLLCLVWFPCEECVNLVSN